MCDWKPLCNLRSPKSDKSHDYVASAMTTRYVPVPDEGTKTHPLVLRVKVIEGDKAVKTNFSGFEKPNSGLALPCYRPRSREVTWPYRNFAAEPKNELWCVMRLWTPRFPRGTRLRDRCLACSHRLLRHIAYVNASYPPENLKGVTMSKS